jgi:hypothetical protein
MRGFPLAVDVLWQELPRSDPRGVESSRQLLRHQGSCPDSYFFFHSASIF